MAKSDLKARPISQRKRDVIKAHITIVLATLAISRNIERFTRISIKQFVKSLRAKRSGILTINNREMLAELEVPELVNSLLI